MTDAQYQVIRKLLKGDFKEYPTPATEGELREIEIDGWYYCVYTKSDYSRNPAVEILQDGCTYCAPMHEHLIDLHSAIDITPEQCAEWDDEQREEMKFADGD